MSLDERSQLATYGRYLDEIAPPITPEEYERVRTIPLRSEPTSRPPLRFRRAALATVGAAAVVLALVGGAALMLFDASDGPTAETLVATTQPPSPTTPPATTAAPPPTVSPRGEFLGNVVLIDPVATQTATALAITPNGEPLIAYKSNSVLKLVRCADPSCPEPVALYETEVDEAYFSLAVKSNGSPVLLYGTVAGGQLVVCNDPDCTDSNDVAIQAVSVLDLIVDTVDVPMVLLETDDELSLLRCSDPSCSAVGRAAPIGPGDVGATLAVDAFGLPAIAYWAEADGQRGEFTVVRCATADCSSIASSAALGIVPAPESNATLIIGAADLPIVAFVDAAAGPRTLRCGDPACVEPGAIGLGIPIPVPSAEGLGAVVAGPEGSLALTYIGSGRLFMAVCADPDCTQADVREISGCACEPPALTIGPGGNPLLSYSDDNGVVLLACVNPTCGEGLSVANPEPPPTPPDPIPDDEGTWIETPSAEAGFGIAVRFTGISSTRLGLIASGDVCGATTDCVTSGWVSTYGLSWQQFDPPPGFNADNVIDGGPGVVILVADSRGNSEPGQPLDSIIFGSPDGRSWSQLEFFGTRTDRDGDGFDGLYLERVFAGPDNLVAYGIEDGVGLAIWTSTNGEAWSRVNPPADGFLATTPLPSRTISGMTAVGSQYLMWGEMWSGQGEPFDVEVAVWRSNDLVNWEFVGPPTDSPTSFLLSGVGWSDGIVIRGMLCDEGGACSSDKETFWVTTEGTEWRQFDGDTSVFFEWGGEIFPMGRQLGAFTDDPRGLTIWTSTDGVMWEFFDNVEQAVGEMFAFTGSTFVGVGNTSDGPATSWIWTPNG